MADLDNCPFCGSPARYWSQRGRYGLFAWVECDGCGARSKSVPTDVSVNEDAFVDSVNADRLTACWNRRDSK